MLARRPEIGINTSNVPYAALGSLWFQEEGIADERLIDRSKYRRPTGRKADPSSGIPQSLNMSNSAQSSPQHKCSVADVGRLTRACPGNADLPSERTDTRVDVLRDAQV
jgi:hypothetical protein